MQEKLNSIIDIFSKLYIFISDNSFFQHVKENKDLTNENFYEDGLKPFFDKIESTRLYQLHTTRSRIRKSLIFIIFFILFLSSFKIAFFSHIYSKFTQFYYSINHYYDLWFYSKLPNYISIIIPAKLIYFPIPSPSTFTIILLSALFIWVILPVLAYRKVFQENILYNVLTSIDKGFFEPTYDSRLIEKTKFTNNLLLPSFDDYHLQACYQTNIANNKLEINKLELYNKEIRSSLTFKKKVKLSTLHGLVAVIQLDKVNNQDCVILSKLKKKNLNNNYKDMQEIASTKEDYNIFTHNIEQSNQEQIEKIYTIITQLQTYISDQTANNLCFDDKLINWLQNKDLSVDKQEEFFQVSFYKNYIIILLPFKNGPFNQSSLLLPRTLDQDTVIIKKIMESFKQIIEQIK